MRCADFGPTPGSRPSSSISSWTGSGVDAGHQPPPSRSPRPAERAHGLALDLEQLGVHVVQGGEHEVLEHRDVVGVDDLRGDRDAEHLARAGGADPHHAAAGHALDLALGGRLLGRHHLLRLREEPAEARRAHRGRGRAARSAADASSSGASSLTVGSVGRAGRDRSATPRPARRRGRPRPGARPRCRRPARPRASCTSIGLLAPAAPAAGRSSAAAPGAGVGLGVDDEPQRHGPAEVGGQRRLDLGPPLLAAGRAAGPFGDGEHGGAVVRRPRSGPSLKIALRAALAGRRARRRPTPASSSSRLGTRRRLGRRRRARRRGRRRALGARGRRGRRCGGGLLDAARAPAAAAAPWPARRGPRRPVRRRRRRRAPRPASAAPAAGGRRGADGAAGRRHARGARAGRGPRRASGRRPAGRGARGRPRARCAGRASWPARRAPRRAPRGRG